MPGRLPSDIQHFLDGYPDSENNPALKANLKFYTNQLRCRPDDKLVEEIHEQWFGDYKKLEYKHGFIQWLFPIQEYGMNYESQPLQKHELEALKKDKSAIGRVQRSYELMLDFYGMRLVDGATGLLDRASPPRDFNTRYKNLVRSSHNNLRISRILKSLSEFGLEHLNAGFLLHVLNEQSEHGELASQSIIGSMDRWWANCIRQEEEREWIEGMILRARKRDGWVFTREMYEAALERRKNAGSLRGEDATVSL